MELLEKKISSECKHTGSVVTMYHDKVELPNGKLANRDVVRHPGAVVIVPVLPDGSLVFVEQYRYPINQVLLELPAGKLDPNEDPAKCAERELQEETGYHTQQLSYLGKMVTTPGFCDEVIYMYKAHVVSASQATPDEDEFLNVKIIHHTNIGALVQNGTLYDSKTITALFFAGYSI